MIPIKLGYRLDASLLASLSLPRERNSLRLLSHIPRRCYRVPKSETPENPTQTDFFYTDEDKLVEHGVKASKDMTRAEDLANHEGRRNLDTPPKYIPKQEKPRMDQPQGSKKQNTGTKHVFTQMQRQTIRHSRKHNCKRLETQCYSTTVIGRHKSRVRHTRWNRSKQEESILDHGGDFLDALTLEVNSGVQRTS